MIFWKKALGIILTAALLPPVSAMAAEEAKGIALEVPVDEKLFVFEAYQINENNYVKLRDVAAALNGSGSQFNVIWNQEKKAIELVSRLGYELVGTELPAEIVPMEKAAVMNKVPIYLDGAEKSFTAYQIDGNTYFKLRELGEALSFAVNWDAESKTVSIDTAKIAPQEETEPISEEKTADMTNIGLGYPAAYPKEGDSFQGVPITRCSETGILGFGSGQKGGIYLGQLDTNGNIITVGSIVGEGKETVGGEYIQIGEYIYWEKEWNIIAETMIAKLNTYLNDVPDDTVANIQGNSIVSEEEQIFFVFNGETGLWERGGSFLNNNKPFI